MDREIADEIFEACERALAELDVAATLITRIADPEERSTLLRALSRSVAQVITTLRLPLVRQFPDLESLEERGDSDTALDEREVSIVSQLTSADVGAIDDALLASCTPAWRKVALVVAKTVDWLGARTEGLPIGYLARRVIVLVEKGVLESQGNLKYMRFSEVRLRRT